MINMMRAELYCTARSVGIYAAIGIMLLLMGISLYMCEPGMITMSVSVNSENIMPELENPIDSLYADELEDMTIGEQREYIKSIGGYQLDRDIVGKSMNLYYVFIFFVTVIITADFTSGAVKNTLSSSTSRGIYFASKTAAVLGLCVLIHLANVYLTYFINLLSNGSGLSSSLWIMTRTALLQLPPMLALASVLTGIAFMMRNAFATVIEAVLMMLCQILLAVVIRLFALPDSVMKYDFQYMINTLAGNPSGSYMAKCYILCGALCVAFLAAGWLSFRRAEIK